MNKKVTKSEHKTKKNDLSKRKLNAKWKQQEERRDYGDILESNRGIAEQHGQ